MRHPPQGPLDRPLASFDTGGVEPCHDVTLSEDPILSDELIQHHQDRGADTAFRPTRANADPEAR